jgi:hypothetical protein
VSAISSVMEHFNGFAAPSLAASATCARSSSPGP